MKSFPRYPIYPKYDTSYAKQFIILLHAQFIDVKYTLDHGMMSLRLGDLNLKENYSPGKVGNVSSVNFSTSLLCSLEMLKSIKAKPLIPQKCLKAKLIAHNFIRPRYF